jgi:hypothetical protein
MIIIAAMAIFMAFKAWRSALHSVDTSSPANAGTHTA